VPILLREDVWQKRKKKYTEDREYGKESITEKKSCDLAIGVGFLLLFEDTHLHRTYVLCYNQKQNIRLKGCCTIMRILFFISLVVAAIWSSTPLANSNAFLAVNHYATVDVKAGDTVWGIAALYVTERDDIRDLTRAIQELNGLKNNAQITPGQVLKVPMKS